MTQNIRPAIAEVRSWLTTLTPLSPRQHDSLADIVDYVTDVEKLNDAVRQSITPGLLPEGSSTMSAMIRQVASTPTLPSIKKPLAAVSNWLDVGAAAPAAIVAAVRTLVDEAERVEAHREKTANGIQITSVGASLATMTDGGRAEAGDATTRLATGLQPLSGQYLDVSLTAQDNLSPALQAAADEISRVMREHTGRQPE